MKSKRYMLMPFQMEDGRTVDLADPKSKPFDSAVWDQGLGRWFGPPDLAYFERTGEDMKERIKRDRNASESNLRAFNAVVEKVLKEFCPDHKKAAAADEFEVAVGE